MLKKRELDLFLIKVPPHHNADVVKVRFIFDLLNTEPRPVAFIAEKIGWNLSNTTRFLTGSKHAEYFEDVGSIPPKVWQLREDAIRLELAGFDEEIASTALHQARDEASDGHKHDPVSKNWFKPGFNFYPYFPIFRERSWDEEERVETRLGHIPWGRGSRAIVSARSVKWPVLNQVIYLDPFVTTCYIITNARGRMKKKLRDYLSECEAIHGSTWILDSQAGCQVFDVMTWSWAWVNLRANNYTFFKRDFSYLPSLWTGQVQEEYGMQNSIGFIHEWMEGGPEGTWKYDPPDLIENLLDKDA